MAQEVVQKSVQEGTRKDTARHRKGAAKQKLTVRQWIILVTVMMFYFCAPEFTAISSTLALMPDFYGVSAASVSWITAMANPSACIAGLVVGAFVGRKISYRTCALLATALFTVFGGLPFLWHGIPFGMLLVSRALFGLGCGCLAPLSQAVVTRMFTNETARSAWIGILYIVFSLGAATGSMVTGALASGGVWQYAYGFYLICIIPFVMTLVFFRDSEINPSYRSVSEKVGDLDEVAPTEQKRHIPGVAAAFIATYTLVTILTQSFFNYGGIAISESGGDTLLVGTVLTAFTVAGIVVAALNAGLWKVFRLWNFPFAFLLITAGYLCALAGYATGGIAWFFAASIIMGVGCCMAGMVMPMVMSVTCSAASLTLAIGLQEVARNLGGFLSAPWLNLIGTVFGDTPDVQFTATFIVGVVATAIAFILAAVNNRKFRNADYRK